ncbi:MAG TPA: tetratricopeptide repeat protein [Kofleriaceae bacterium]|nr:tetratricopeptide repeat protein [Kofleriaceae bacterium]
MAALPKPHRIAFLVPDVKIDGPDAAYEREAAVLLWTACIETCQRHPRLAVLDADATPLFPQDGHFAPQHAGLGGRATDAFFGPTRRDEVLWLELRLGPKPSVVRLHAVGRDGKVETFDALGPKLGEQVQQVLGAWLTARKLGTLPRRFEEISSDNVLAALRVIAPTLAEQARAWSLPVATKPTWSLSIVEDEGEDEAEPMDPHDQNAVEADEEFDAAFDAAIDSTIDSTLDLEPAPPGAPPEVPRRRSLARPLVGRLPQAFKLPALRLLELALREDLSDAILAVEPGHPQALFGQFEQKKEHGKDFALLRKIIAAAPGWARPYEELRVDEDSEDEENPQTPSALEAVAAAGIATLSRPGGLQGLETVGDLLSDDGRVDEAIRLLERGVEMHMEDPGAHLALLALHDDTDREGARLEQAFRSGSLHGCPMDSLLPWYPDQIHIDLRVATALLAVGRLDEAIALRANRLEGREATWPHHTRILASWRKDPRFVAWCYAREGYFRGDDARAVEGFSRIEPDDNVDLAIFLDSLVALGREDEVPLAWAQYGLGRGYDGPVARLAAARALMAAGEYRRGIEEMWRVELTEPGRDEQVAVARIGLIMAAAPIDVIEAALGERVAIGAPSLARRMARDVADFVPAAAKSGVVARALSGGTKPQPMDFDTDWLSGFAPDTRGRRVVDQMFGELGSFRKGPPQNFDIADELKKGDHIVNRWLEVAFAEASEEDPAALAQAASYIAAQALGRYLAATTYPPTTIAGALRAVAGGALGLVRKHRRSLGDREARALLGAIDPLLRRVDRWVGSTWLATVERSLGIDERSGGDVLGFARDYPSVAGRILGPEETAVLSWSVARLHRDKPADWAAKVVVQAARLASHTGYVGCDEWSDAVVAQLAAREIEQDDAIDALHTACYLAQGISAIPCVHAARVLFDAGRAPAALSVLSAGLSAAGEEWRDKALASLTDVWKRSKIDVPLEFEKVAAGVFEALQKGDPLRGEKLARWAVAYDPKNGEAHRNLGLGLAMQGKATEALAHLVKSTPEQATQILSGVLYQSGKLPDAMAVLDYASRWYVRADQWLTYGGIAYAAQDNPRTVKAYALAYQLDPDAFDASQLNAYAGVLDEVGDYAMCEKIANHLLRVAGKDKMWLTNGWNHLACAYIGLDKFEEAIELANRAVKENPLPDNAGAFAATLQRAFTKTKTPPTPPAAQKPREKVFELMEAGDLAAAAELIKDKSWRVRRAALQATRFRFASENQVEVTPRARAAALAILADTVGTMDKEALLARSLALQIREQAYFARDPVPKLGDRMTRDSFYAEFRARGGVVLGEDAPPAAAFVDRVVVQGGRIERASDYISLLRDLANLPPKEALAQFDLDEAGYIEIATAWAQAMEKDPTIAKTIATGLAKR